MTSPLEAFASRGRTFPSTGFSLIELLVVMAILGILIGLTVSIGPSLVGAAGMSGSLSMVSSSVSLARSEAIRNRKQTYFVLGPESPLDGRSFSMYAILQREGTNYAYVQPWKKLPTGMLFHPAAVSNPPPKVTLPYPHDGGAPTDLRVISFMSDGSLDEDIHSTKPRLALQAGSRVSPSDPPAYRGSYLTNEVVVERMSGKVKVEREGETNP